MTHYEMTLWLLLGACAGSTIAAAFWLLVRSFIATEAERIAR